jgi:hypothetical protein
MTANGRNVMAEREILEETGRPYVGFEPQTQKPRGVVASERMLALALEMLSARSLVWVATLGGGGLWTWAVLHPEPLRLVAALGYSLSILLPILYRDSRGG